VAKRHAALSAAVGLTLLAAPAASMPAYATFPGSNGRLVTQRESPAGDHTQTDLYTINPDGSGLVRLTATPNRNEFGPEWNATGRRITFWRTPAPFGPGSIWVMGARGHHQHQLTHGFDARDPSWNPAGTRIAFTRIAGADSNLWTMRASDGGGLHRLTSGPALDFEAAWSPDGTRIAFTRGFAEGDPGNICVLDLNSGMVHRITHSPAYDHQAGWAPNGKNLVFERDFDSSSAIFTVRADGSHLTRLTFGPHFDVGPTFSPDGSRIAFGSDRGPATLDDLWQVNSDGTGLRQMRHLRYSEGFPDWQPLP
jgi:Tol biopolymer transport system component